MITAPLAGRSSLAVLAGAAGGGAVGGAVGAAVDVAAAAAVACVAPGFGRVVVGAGRLGSFATAGGCVSAPLTGTSGGGVAAAAATNAIFPSGGAS